MTRLPLRELAPAKVNLGLFVGPSRPHDGRHELVSVMQSITLADQLTLERLPGGSVTGGDGVGDLVLCPGVPGENLAARALRLFRQATGWNAPALRLSIAKRIPIAAGLGGGSADAAAALRLSRQASGGLGSEELLLELAAQLGADVPAQVAPGRWLATGAGERLRALPRPREPLGVLVLPVAAELSTAAVYARADELNGMNAGRSAERGASELARIAAALERAYAQGETLPRAWRLGASGDAGVGGDVGHAAATGVDLLHNDLQAAALSLCPEIEPALAQARAAGAEAAFISGSGPTVVGLFAGADGPARARQAAMSGALAKREPGALWADAHMRHNLGR